MPEKKNTPATNNAEISSEAEPVSVVMKEPPLNAEPTARLLRVPQEEVPGEKFEETSYGGFDIRVEVFRNEEGAWDPVLNIKKGAAVLEPHLSEDPSPGWLTPREAIRAGVERARFLIDKQIGL